MARTGNSREKGKDKEDETKKKKTAKQKKIAKQSPRPSTVSRVLDKVLALVCLVTILARVDFLTVSMKTLAKEQIERPQSVS